METQLVTYTMFLQEKSIKYLDEMARDVNFVWNQVNNICRSRLRLFKMYRSKYGYRFFYGPGYFLHKYELTKDFCKGGSKFLSLTQATINEVVGEHHKKRVKDKKFYLNYRKNLYDKWIPIVAQETKVRFLEKRSRRHYVYEAKYAGRTFLLKSRRELVGEIRSSEFIHDGVRWFFSVSAKKECAEPKKITNDNTIGVDLGATYMITTSNDTVDGENRKREKELSLKLKELDDKIAQTQRNAARKKELLTKKYSDKMRGGKLPRKYMSSNLKKDYVKTRKLHRKKANIRSEFTHIRTTELAKENAVVVMEKLSVKNMTKSAKGTEESPGKNVAAKSGLNRVFLAKNPGKAKELLTYKTKLYGSRLEIVNPKNTSKTCSCCGNVEKKKGEQRNGSDFECVKCGYKDDADINAAKNIRDKIAHCERPAATAGG